MQPFNCSNISKRNLNLKSRVYLPYWHADTLNIPCGAHGGPCGQKHILSGLLSTDAKTRSVGVKR